MLSLQAPSAAVMIRPHAFASNPETRDDNAFQTLSGTSANATSAAARDEHDQAVRQLRDAGITVHVFDDFGDLNTPDSVFPNNWFSTHPGGHIAIYPMFVPSRRRERRTGVIELLKQKYRVQDVIDYSGLEQDNLALEGTGAMVLDHVGRIAYTVTSNRADPVLLERFCTHFNYEPIAFEARDATGRDVYHTNVLMGIGTQYALICLDMIPDPDRRATVRDRLEESGRTVIDLTHKQIAEFAGNAIELTGRDGLVLALSSRALAALTPDQVVTIRESATPLPLSVPTIETAGGSVRCMIAGVHLSRR
ncbi:MULTISPECIES: citrulline utilization hydrolase CtlX [unclassified Ruegeria]|uniref:citrulline utilization hydrolase CtlX n=1 Tax=unclassified Ruegeria TaxID=2625375 RepID=UPI001492B63D|nr:MULTISPECIES: arginine deiminase-related protein [unclassified Ruegeria]NOD87125.1 amidinotransferase [Ruegeria sp. HKCCD4318]NOE12680.1 amidinotransferase [Ruegeria sp. HKCCD4318-2]NOG09155.1 amidinotransferase [Ruegeria sp. HKCCD4315]